MSALGGRYYVAAFLLLLAGTTFVMPELVDVDWYVFNKLNLERPTWPNDLVLLDVPWNNNQATFPQYRSDLAAALEALSRYPARPSAVILDVSISGLPLGLAELASALGELTKKAPVYAALKVRSDLTGEPDPNYLAYNAYEQIYRNQNLIKGYGHTEFNVKGNAVWFKPCLPVSAIACVPALVVDVAEKQYHRAYDRPADPLPIIVNMGNPETFKVHTWEFRRDKLPMVQPSADAIPSSTDLANKVVIIGNLQYDRILDSRPGTELLAWALSDQICTKNTCVRRQLLIGPWWLLGFTLIFSGLALAIFSKLYKQWEFLYRRLWLVSTLTVLLVLAAFAAVVIGLLWKALNYVYPQVVFVILAVVYVTALAWQYARAQQRRKALEENVTFLETGTDRPKYDVFISYSRTPKENSNWVTVNVYEPLTRIVIEGKPLRIFFDATSIRVGTSWYFKLAEAIQDSRCFVAVYSDEYFKKDFCQFEMTKAAIRWVKDRKHFALLPIARSQVQVPTQFDHIQFISAGADPSTFIIELSERIKEQLSTPDV